ncbi:unnamed protein product [Adineta ricciae]|uniref:G-protein coupled receptors family 1 profile domain-containing protein n=1 Tax=Adineta ricciae TaxID=249248 RepID=A0A814CMR6_ADIRI|nr:unnamed protein product [Adineta ricciae]
MNTSENGNSTMTTVFDHQLRFVEQVVLGSIFVLALIGNISVLVVMLATRNRRTTRMAFFILHLTIADLLVAFFSVLPMFIWKIRPTFLDGEIMCRVFSYFMLTTTYISVYTLVVMAIDRYQAIVHPLSIYTWTQTAGLYHMAAVWFLSLVLASPQLFIFRLEYDPKHETKSCRAKFLGSDRTWELVYISWNILAQFGLPVCVLIYCYGSVYFIVNRSFAMYRLTDNARTMSITNLPTLSLPKNLNHLSASTLTVERTSKASRLNHIRIHYPSADGSTVSNATYYNKSPSLMYPVVFRLRRSSIESSAQQSSMSLDGNKCQQRYGASHFLSRARLKTIKLTFIVVLAYILCSAPFYVGLIMMVLNNNLFSQKTMNWLITIFTLLFNLNSCSNPIICLTLSSTLFQRKRDPKQPPAPSRRSQSSHENTDHSYKRKLFKKRFVFL